MKYLQAIILASLTWSCSDDCLTAYEPTVYVWGAGNAIINDDTLHVDSSMVWIGNKAWSGDEFTILLDSNQYARLETSDGRVSAGISERFWMRWP